MDNKNFHKETSDVIRKVHSEVGSVTDCKKTKDFVEYRMTMMTEFDMKIKKISHNRDLMKILAIFGLVFIFLMLFGIIIVATRWV